MVTQGITLTALLLALAALTHAADTTHKNDARLFYDGNNYSVIVGKECILFIGVLLLGLLLLPHLLGLETSANVAQPYDYAPATGYGASAPAYDERTTFSVRQFIEDAVNKFQ